MRLSVFRRWFGHYVQSCVVGMCLFLELLLAWVAVFRGQYVVPQFPKSDSGFCARVFRGWYASFPFWIVDVEVVWASS